MNFSTLTFLLLAGSFGAAAADLAENFDNLKQAVEKKDVAQVRQLAATASSQAKEMIAQPSPSGEDEKDAWTKRVAWAKDVEVYTEYALYATAIQSPPATLIDLLGTLEKQNPKSKYLEDAYAPYFAALNSTGAAAKIPAIAEKAVASHPDNEDVLMVVAETAMSRKQSQQAQTYANRLIAVLNKHSKPEGMAAADWERRRNTFLGRAHWISGVVAGEKNQYVECDKNLRAALPLIKGNDAMMGPALFYLGVANYNLSKMTLDRRKMMDAYNFSDQASRINGPYAQQAWRNAATMKTEAERMR
jgi:hypothetical protein